jgi:hypothetical protein
MIPRKIQIINLIDLANNLVSQLESVNEASDEDIAKYNKTLITMKSQHYQLRAFMHSADESRKREYIYNIKEMN